MRISFVFLAGLLALSHAVAADNVISLPQPLKLDVPSKDTTPASGKEVIKTETPLTPTAAATAEAEAKKALTPAQKAANARKETVDLQSQQELGEKIRAKLEALRAQNAGKKPAVKPIPYVSRNSLAKGKSKASAKQSGKEKTAGATDAHDDHVKHWAYEGDVGPAKWGKLNPSWAQCDTGKRQSPIDIRDGIKVDLERIQFEYKPVNFKVTDNGHTVQVDLQPGNRIVLTGKAYELVQFHFHRPSEERVNGKAFQMVVHLVHKSEDNKLAVVALLVEEGVANSLIQTVWNNLPLEKTDPVVPMILLDMNQVLPMAREYYTYMGSLTTPPCSEGVLWLVMKQPIKLSPAQIGIFARLYPMNARPIQTNDGRMIKESN